MGLLKRFLDYDKAYREKHKGKLEENKERMKQDWQELKESGREIKDEFGGLKGKMKEETQTFKEDIKAETDNLKEDLRTIRTEQKEDIRTIRAEKKENKKSFRQKWKEGYDKEMEKALAKQAQKDAARQNMSEQDKFAKEARFALKAGIIYYTWWYGVIAIVIGFVLVASFFAWLFGGL